MLTALDDRRFWKLLAVLAITCLAGWGFKYHCVPGGWTNAVQYTTGCYSDAMPFWSDRGIAEGKLPYLQTRMEYPVLTGALTYAEGRATRTLFGRDAGAGDFLTVVTFVNALLAALVLAMLWEAGMDRRRLWCWACAPPLVLYLGHNWDMLAVAFAMGAMLLAREGRLTHAAAVAALGVAAKLFPILMLPLLGLSALFAPGMTLGMRLKRAALVTLAAIGAWGAVNLPVALAAPQGWDEFYRFSAERSGTEASVWQLLGTVYRWWIPIPERNLYSAVSFVAGAAAILGIGWWRHGTARLWLLFAPMLAWFLLTSKVWSPQFDLWLYPLLLVAAPRLTPVVLFVLGDIAAYFAEFWLFAAAEGAHPAATTTDIAWAAAIRGGAMLWLIAEMLWRAPPAWVTERDRSRLPPR